MLHGPLVLLLMYCYIWNKFSLNQGELWQNAPYPSCFYVCKHTIPDAYTPSCIQFCLFSILHANDEYAVILRVNSARLNLKEATEGQQQQQKRICWPCCQETANNCHWCNIVGIMQWWAFVYCLFLLVCLYVLFICFVLFLLFSLHLYPRCFIRGDAEDKRHCPATLAPRGLQRKGEHSALWMDCRSQQSDCVPSLIPTSAFSAILFLSTCPHWHTWVGSAVCKCDDRNN